jgi:uncharacterized protein YidB (DUF937 family)
MEEHFVKKISKLIPTMLTMLTPAGYVSPIQSENLA